MSSHWSADTKSEGTDSSAQVTGESCDMDVASSQPSSSDFGVLDNA